MSVPCGTCNACCRHAHLQADLTETEAREFPDAVWCDGLGRWRLPKDSTGACAYLADGKCSIYHRRPASCREYDCRTYLVGANGVACNQREFAADCVRRWSDWRLERPEDIDALFAWHASVIRVAQDANRPRSSVGICVSIVSGFFKIRPRSHEPRRKFGLRRAREILRKQDRDVRDFLCRLYAAATRPTQAEAAE